MLLIKSDDPSRKFFKKLIKTAGEYRLNIVMFTGDAVDYQGVLSVFVAVTQLGLQQGEKSTDIRQGGDRIMLAFESTQLQSGIILKHYGFKAFGQGVHCVNYPGEVFCPWAIEGDKSTLRETIGLLNNFTQWFQNGAK